MLETKWSFLCLWKYILMAFMHFKQNEVINAFKANCQRNKDFIATWIASWFIGFKLCLTPQLGFCWFRIISVHFSLLNNTSYRSPLHEATTVDVCSLMCGLWWKLLSLGWLRGLRQHGVTGIIPNNGKALPKNTGACGSDHNFWLKISAKMHIPTIAHAQKKPCKGHAGIFFL